MRATIITEPTVEPISASELKLHIRLDSGTFDDNLTSTQTVPPGLHTVDADYVAGTGVDVLGNNALAVLKSGTNGSSGTVDAKILESDDDITYADWAGGGFTQVTEANDNTTYKIEYTGIKQYIRVDHKVLVASCDLGIDIEVESSSVTEDNLLAEMIESSRIFVEEKTRRALITQTWEYYLDRFPAENFITLPFGNLQSVTTVIYKDSDGDETTMVVDTEYIVETNGDMYGRIVLPYGISWPSFTPYPSKPITIKFVCGYGDTSSTIPDKIISAIKMKAAKLYETRGEPLIGTSINASVADDTFDSLLSSSILWWVDYENR